MILPFCIVIPLIAVSLKVDFLPCNRRTLELFTDESQLEPSWKVSSSSWIWAELSLDASLLITISTFMSSSPFGTWVEAASTTHQSFIVLTVSKAKSAYHFTLGKKKYHPLRGQVTQLLWSSKDRPAKWVILSMLSVMEYQFLKGLR